MANVWAIKSGDWSDTTVWNTGALPTSADDVYANNFNVNVNQNIDVVSLRSTGITGVNAGGTFTFNTGGVIAEISNNLIMNPSVSTSFILITASSGDVIINAHNSIFNKVTTSNASFFLHTGNCNLTINAISFQGIGNASAGYFLQKSGLGILNINANIIGDTINNSSTGMVLLNSNSTNYINGNIIAGNHGIGSRCVVANAGELNINGNITGGGGTGAYNAIVWGSSNNLNIIGNIFGNITAAISCSSGNINVVGLIKGGNYNGSVGIGIGGTAIFNHVGTSEASAYGSAISCNSPTTSTVTCTGPFLKNGYIVAIASQTLRINFGSNSYFQFKKSNGEDIDYVSTIEGYNYPATSDVRYGVEYKSGLAIGTCHVPTPDNVRKNIPVDNTVGTSDNVNAEDILDAIQNSSLPIAERLRNVATVESTGAQFEAYQ